MGKYEQKLNFKLYSQIDLLNRVINKKMESLELEFYSGHFISGGRKIDILAKDNETNFPCFIESQLTDSDEIHYRELKKIVDSSLPSYNLIWIASSFNSIWHKRLLVDVVNTNAIVSVYFIELSKRIVESVYRLKRSDINIIKEIDEEINVQVNDLNLVHQYENKREEFTSFSIDDVIYPLVHHNSKLLMKILRKMRGFSDYLGIHYYKDLSKDRLVFGLGRDQTSAYLGITNHRNTIYFSIAILNDKVLYEKIFKERERLDKQFNRLLNFDMQKGRINFELQNNEFTRNSLLDFFAHSSAKLIEEIYGIIVESEKCQ